MVANFNSIKVRLELIVQGTAQTAKTDFNSIKVRLEQAAEALREVIAKISIP